MLTFKCKTNFFNIIKNIKIIIIFFIKSFNIILIIEKKKIVKTFGVKVLNLKAKFIILNKFAIILQLN